jgi:DNA polymerase-4
VVERLQEYQMQTKTISINIKYPNFVSQNRSLTIDHHTDDYEIILLRAIKLYHNNFLDQNVRLVGVSLSHLLSNDKLTVNSELFDDYVKTDINVINKNEISVIVNEINRQFARNIITTADKKNKLR